MQSFRKLIWVTGCGAAAAAIGYGCAATDDVIARGDPTSDAGSGEDAKLPGQDGSSSFDGQIDALAPSDGAVNETCEAAAKAGSTGG